jgi:hypothetical protein
MVKFRAHVMIEATSEAQAKADLLAMSAAHTNKSVTVNYIEQMV